MEVLDAELEQIQNRFTVCLHGVDVCDRDATNSIDDYVVFVAGGGADGEVAGFGYAEEDGAGIGGRAEC